MDDLSTLTAKLYAEVRDHIKSLTSQPVYSVEWNTMVTTVCRIASIVASERAMAIANTKAGKVVETLWDPRGDEWTLRHLLEEGKLNLLLRLLDSYLQHEQEATISARAKSVEGDLSATLASLTVQPASTDAGTATIDPSLSQRFVESITAIACTAWSHREAIQTTDLPLTCSCLQRAMALGLRPEAAKARPGVALLPYRFFAALAGNLAAVGEKLVPELGRYGLFACLPSHACAVAEAGLGGTHAPGVEGGDSELLSGLVGASRLLACEEFSLVRTVMLAGSSAGSGAPGPDAVMLALVSRADVGAQAPTVAAAAVALAPGSRPLLPTGVEPHVTACASLSKGRAAAVLGLNDVGTKRRVRPWLDYASAVERAVKR